MESPTASDLYRAHAPGALRLAYLLTGEIESAHDLMQDAFVKMLARPHVLLRDEAFGAYLRVTIVNLSRSRWRRMRLEQRWARGLPQEPPPEADGYEQRDLLRRALQTLPERQRVAIVLRYFEDLTEQETADAMGTSVPAIKSLVQRGMETLRTHLKDERYA